MSALATLVPFALGETWFAVFGGMIPIVGLALIGAVIWHAAKPPPKSRKEDEPK